MCSNTGIQGAVSIGASVYIRIYTQGYRRTYFIRVLTIETSNNQIQKIISLLKKLRHSKTIKKRKTDKRDSSECEQGLYSSEGLR
jgi:hypothetical protein